MAKTPFYKNDEEKAMLIAMRDAFVFDAPPPLNMNIMIAGMQGSGKTHLMCTLAGEQYGELFLLDTEQRAHLVTQKFDPKWVHRAIVRDYQEMVAAIKKIQKMTKGGIVGIDSGTDLQKYAEEKYLEDVGKDRMGLPITYPQMYSYIYAVIDDLKASGFTIVWTTKVKDEYAGDKATGRKIPRIFQDLPYRADLVIQLETNGDRTITKNGFIRDNVVLTKDMTLPQILKAAQGS